MIYLRRFLRFRIGTLSRSARCRIYRRIARYFPINLLISFALLNIPDTHSAALYFSFEGGKGEVSKLLNAVAPSLETAGFVEQQTS